MSNELYHYVYTDSKRKEIHRFVLYPAMRLVLTNVPQNFFILEGMKFSNEWFKRIISGNGWGKRTMGNPENPSLFQVRDSKRPNLQHFLVEIGSPEMNRISRLIRGSLEYKESRRYCARRLKGSEDPYKLGDYLGGNPELSKREWVRKIRGINSLVASRS